MPSDRTVSTGSPGNRGRIRQFEALALFVAALIEVNSVRATQFFWSGRRSFLETEQQLKRKAYVIRVAHGHHRHHLGRGGAGQASGW